MGLIGILARVNNTLSYIDQSDTIISYKNTKYKYKKMYMFIYKYILYIQDTDLATSARWW